MPLCFIAAGVQCAPLAIDGRKMRTHDMYLVLLDAFGAWVGRAWRETDDDAGTYREMLIRDLLSGMVARRHAEIAAELKRCRDDGENIPASVQHLLEMAIR